jgi:septal ring factor EnvC (AmiA/AmiB activator)
MKTRILFVLVAAILLAGTLNAPAQQDTSTRKGKFQKIVKEKFMEKVGVDEKTADKFMETMKSHKDEMKQLQQKRKSIMKEITDNPNSADVQSKLEELLDIDYRMHMSRKNFFTELKTFMTPQQIAGSMSFQKNMKDFMKQNKKGKNKRGKSFNGPDDEEPVPGPEFPDRKNSP